ncbi:non-SMC mitotic condensation complex subunit 1-domain-containing protein [Halteromyces radiatus]|uniref:non-SMC mitotic condensation complex subunit 1-domain-containing protein n=1 Tax=Halteromyces radiatus TaxID=101107 RepID=UPI002220E6A5|nr:non-SMC mitotic condensation complex subunit 1-domain-containing protein [Halteromyces radiatus]KAI8092765.1 non-SMC mitotic condensation complex subunit 1-domain-containing protein [Halteromyces radiatus]
MTSSFVLQEEIRLLQNDTSNYHIENEIDIEGQSEHDLARSLNYVTEHIEVSSNTITDPSVFDKVRSFLKYFEALTPRIAARLHDILLSAFRTEVKTTSDDLANNETSTFGEHRTCLEHYIFLIYWYLELSEEAAKAAASAASTKSKRGKGRVYDDRPANWTVQQKKTYDLLAWLLELKLTKIWTLPPDRTALINLFTKSCYHFFENASNLKVIDLKLAIFRILSLCVKNYDHLLAAQATVIQNLQYWEHCAEPMAEWLHYLIDKYDYGQLTDELLREIGNQEFKDTAVKDVKDTANPKTFSTFLLKLTDLAPRSVLKNLGVLIQQLDSESYAIRLTLIEIAGKLIVELTQNSEESQSQKDQINGFFDILEERMLDPISFCRVKVLQTYIKILDLRVKFPKRRQTLCSLAIRHLEDKSSSVRKYAVRVLTKLISTHPYDMYGGELTLENWQDRLSKLEAELEASTTESDVLGFVAIDALQPTNRDEQPEEPSASAAATPLGNETQEVEMNDSEKENAAITDSTSTNDNDNNNNSDEDIVDDTLSGPTNDNVNDNDDVPTTKINATPCPKTVISEEKMQQLTLMKTFLIDAVKFIEQIHKSIPIVGQLLSSKSKLEVVESMDFFMTAYLYKVKLAKAGLKKMLHLIWIKDTSDEGKGIKMKLLDCYRTLYIEPDTKLSKRQNINNIAKYLIELTYHTTLAELTSLEQVLSTLMAEGDISNAVVEKLWEVYGFSKGQISKQQRRGAIIILGMLAKANTEVASEKIDLMLHIGLGSVGRTDLVIAKYTCIALQRLAGTKSDKARGVYEGKRFPMSHPVFAKLKEVVQSQSTSMEWFGMTEQALNAIYLLGEHPDLLCGEIIKSKTREIFSDDQDDGKKPESNDMTNDSNDGNDDAMDVDNDISKEQEEQQTTPLQSQSLRQSVNRNPYELSQLFFIVGHVALKQTVHLEVVEAVWKRKKLTKEEGKEKSSEAMEDELEQVGGTAEDDIGDAIIRIREREILFSGKSLLARFGPLLIEVCARNKVYTDRTLQTMATLALGKFMCVSSDFCERHLQLLLTILEKSKDPTIRSNIVIALGDMAVCFNTLIDDNITFLYNRLADEDKMVKKNAVMVLTHLILNGMVKVKGQISEMAKCLEDSDQRIADLAKLFFTELANKDNAIYNNLPDIISNLTAKNSSQVDEESFHRIMKFIFSFEFVEKGKHAENVVDKLCQRFQNAEEGRGWRDIAFCLSLLPYKTEKSYRKLLDGLPYYQDKLHDDAVHKYFLEIIAKGRSAQKLQKAELKTIVDELEAKVESISGISKEDKQKAAKPKKKVVLRAIRKDQRSSSSSVPPSSVTSTDELSTII